MKNTINIGIGFATGRRSFQNVLKTYLYNWQESGICYDESINFNLFVAYDLTYKNTPSTEFTNLSQEVVDFFEDIYFVGEKETSKECKKLIEDNIITEADCRLIFGTGYASSRNAVVYSAIKNKMDYLIFLDDDEYPMAVTKTRRTAIWSGQHVLMNHLDSIRNADITNGHHCGYISPIPHIEFDKTLTERDFKAFIEAISNDILNWGKLRALMDSGGVTYADTAVLIKSEPEEVVETGGCKFISGGNLCINLTDKTRVFPFYNPPGARGEDTFLSTCLKERKVMRVPCYTFHDGFSTYKHLLNGVLPLALKPITTLDENTKDRFFKACLGWVRYKPLLLYITNQPSYEKTIELVLENLRNTLPKLSEYFDDDRFMGLEAELLKYHRNSKRHFDDFQKTKDSWQKLLSAI